MGCGSSKSTGGGGDGAPKQSGARNDNPPIDPINVPDLDPKYPAPTPPPNGRDQIYKPAEYSAIDARVKQQLNSIRPTTYDALIKSLCANCTTDLQKLRAIMVWLFLQDIYGSFYSGVTDPYTPRGYMKLIKQGSGSYESFFAQLCRAAGIQCVVIRGVAKGDKYEVGQQDMTQMESAWNGVYVAGGWRLVHPLWTIFKEKKINKNGKPPSPGTKNPSLDDFFFLIDPNKMICFCKPHADPWQLLKVKWEHRKFVKSPKFTQHYFTSGLMLPKKYNAIIYSDNGICVIDFDHQSYAEPTIDAKVTFIQEMSSDEMPANVNLNDYTVRAGSSTRKSVVIRFPVRGRYEVDVFGGTEAKEPKIVEFRIECDDVGRSPQPFPMNPANGFGLQPVASQFGISDPVPDSGIIQVRPAQVKHFSFTCTQRLEAQASLFHNTVNSESFEDFITTKTMSDEVHVTVAVPDEPHLEYALQISVRPEGASRQFTVVADYLLVDENWRKRMAIVTPRPGVNKNEEERIRKAIIAATHKNDIAQLEHAIEEFERNGLPDNGDLTRARHKLVQLHLQRLRKTTLDRKLDELDNAIETAKKSPVALDLIDTKEMNDAVMTRQQLKRLSLYMHKVLALNKATISEIHSYQRPRPLVHTVMKATFRILGEPNHKLQDWSFIQTSMRTLGRNSMISRMKRTDVVHLKKMQMKDAERYLGETNKHLVRMCSAGAGTFYVWSNNMISEFHGENNMDPLEIWNDKNKWAKTKPKKKVNPSDSRASNPYNETPRDYDSYPDTSRDENSYRDTQRDTNRDTQRDTNRDTQRDTYRDAQRDTKRDTQRDSNRDTQRDAQRDTYRDTHRDSIEDDWNPNANSSARKDKSSEPSDNSKNKTKRLEPINENYNDKTTKKVNINDDNVKANKPKKVDDPNAKKAKKVDPYEANPNSKKPKKNEPGDENVKPKKPIKSYEDPNDRRYSEHFDSNLPPGRR